MCPEKRWMFVSAIRCFLSWIVHAKLPRMCMMYCHLGTASYARNSNTSEANGGPLEFCGIDLWGSDRGSAVISSHLERAWRWHSLTLTSWLTYLTCRIRNVHVPGSHLFLPKNPSSLRPQRMVSNSKVHFLLFIHNHTFGFNPRQHQRSNLQTCPYSCILKASA